MKKMMFTTLLLMMVSLLPSLTLAATVRLAWDANTEPDLAGYKIYHSTASGGPYALLATLGTVTTWNDIGAVEGHHCYVATAYDTVNNESGYSNEVCLQVDTQAPQAPQNLRVLGVVK